MHPQLLPRFALFTLAILLSLGARAQVGIGTVTPSTNSILHLVGTNKGLLLPYGVDASGQPGFTPTVSDSGLVVYSGGNLHFWSGAAWVTLTAGSSTGVNFNVTAPQAGGNRTRRLFDVISGGGNGVAPGARIQSAGNGANNGATGLTVSATGVGTSSSTGLVVSAAGGTGTNIAATFSATGGTNNYAALFTGNVGIGVATPAALLSIAAGTTARPSMNVATGVAPTTPATGDVWVDATGNLFYRNTTTSVNLSGGTGANTTLSNLGVTAINADLTFAPANRILSVASPAAPGAGNSLSILGATANTNGLGGGINITAGNANSSGPAQGAGAVIIRGGNAATGPGGGGNVQLIGGDDGTGINSAGSIFLTPGTVVGSGRQGGVAIGAAASVGPADFMVVQPQYTPEGGSTYMVQLNPTNVTVNAGNFGIALRVSGAFGGASTQKYAAAFENGNVGIGTITPGSGLQIASSLGLGITPNAATTLTLDATHLSVVNSNAAATTNTLPAATAAIVGRTYYVWSTGAAGVTVNVSAPGTESLNGVLGGTFTVATGQCAVLTCVAANNWRAVIQAPTAGGGGGWGTGAGVVNLATQTDNVGIGVAASTNNKVTVENATVPMGTGILYAGQRTRVLTSSVTVAADTLAAQRNIVRVGAGAAISVGTYSDVSHTGNGLGVASFFGKVFSTSGPNTAGAIYNVQGGGTGNSIGVELNMDRGAGAGNATGVSANINYNAGTGGATAINGSIGGSAGPGSVYNGIAMFVSGEADGVTNTAGNFSISTTNPSGTNVGLNVNVSSAGTNYAALLNGGNVGIGNTAPSAALDVTGDIAVTGNARTISFDAASPSSTIQVGTVASGNANTLTLRSGTTAAVGNGGNIALLSGNGAGAGNVGGAVQISAGSNGTGIGGTIYLSPGAGSTAANAGVLQADVHNRGAQGGAATPSIASGTYVPSIIAGTGTGSLGGAANGAITFMWARVGNVVTVTGRLLMDYAATAVAANANFTITIPFGGNFTSVNDAVGVATEAGSNIDGGRILSVNGSNTVNVFLNRPAGFPLTNDLGIFVTFQYEVK